MFVQVPLRCTTNAQRRSFYVFRKKVRNDAHGPALGVASRRDGVQAAWKRTAIVGEDSSRLARGRCDAGDGTEGSEGLQAAVPGVRVHGHRARPALLTVASRGVKAGSATP